MLEIISMAGTITLHQFAQLLDEKLDKVLDKKLDEKLDKKLDEKLLPIREELSSAQKTLATHTKLLKSHSKLLRSLKKDQEVMLNMLDREQMSQRIKIKRIEEKLNISSV